MSFDTIKTRSLKYYDAIIENNEFLYFTISKKIINHLIFLKKPDCKVEINTIILNYEENIGYEFEYLKEDFFVFKCFENAAKFIYDINLEEIKKRLNKYKNYNKLQIFILLEQEKNNIRKLENWLNDLKKFNINKKDELDSFISSYINANSLKFINKLNEEIKIENTYNIGDKIFILRLGDVEDLKREILETEVSEIKYYFEHNQVDISRTTYFPRYLLKCNSVMTYDKNDKKFYLIHTKGFHLFKTKEEALNKKISILNEIFNINKNILEKDLIHKF